MLNQYLSLFCTQSCSFNRATDPAATAVTKLWTCFDFLSTSCQWCLCWKQRMVKYAPLPRKKGSKAKGKLLLQQKNIRICCSHDLVVFLFLNNNTFWLGIYYWCTIETRNWKLSCLGRMVLVRRHRYLCNVFPKLHSLWTTVTELGFVGFVCQQIFTCWQTDVETFVIFFFVETLHKFFSLIHQRVAALILFVCKYLLLTGSFFFYNKFFLLNPVPLLRMVRQL